MSATHETKGKVLVTFRGPWEAVIDFEQFMRETITEWIMQPGENLSIECLLISRWNEL